MLGPIEQNTDNISEIYIFILKNHLNYFRFFGVENQNLIHDIIEASCVILDKVKKGNKCFSHIILISLSMEYEKNKFCI